MKTADEWAGELTRGHFLEQFPVYNRAEVASVFKRCIAETRAATLAEVDSVMRLHLEILCASK